jgi:hypothetical protein
MMLRLMTGLFMLLLFAWLMAWGPLPAGWIGDVIQHNLDTGKDATALFYTEVDDFPQL